MEQQQLKQEHEEATAFFRAICERHDKAVQVERDLKERREALRRRVSELEEQLRKHDFVNALCAMAATLGAHQAVRGGGTFECPVCRERYPCAMDESVLCGAQQKADDENIGHLLRWLGSWQMRYTCGHSVCRLCYERSLKAIYMPDFFIHTALGSACPVCRGPRYVMFVEDEQVEWAANDVIMQHDNPLYITTPPDEDSANDDDYSCADEDESDGAS